jgi:hypothetical protein
MGIASGAVTASGLRNASTPRHAYVEADVCDSQVQLPQHEEFSHVERYIDLDDMGVFWTLEGLYGVEHDVGMWIEVWLPPNVRWLNPTYREEAPRVGLYARGGVNRGGMTRGRQWIQLARNAIRRMPNREAKMKRTVTSARSNAFFSMISSRSRT